MKNLQESIRNDINKLNEETQLVNHPIREGDALQMLDDITGILSYFLDGGGTQDQINREFFDDRLYDELYKATDIIENVHSKAWKKKQASNQ